MALGPTNPSPAQAHVGLVVYPKQLAVEHAGGSDCHRDADDVPRLPEAYPRATETHAYAPVHSHTQGISKNSNSALEIK